MTNTTQTIRKELTTNCFEIIEERFEVFEEKFIALVRRAKRLKLATPTFQVVGQVTKPLPNPWHSYAVDKGFSKKRIAEIPEEIEVRFKLVEVTSAEIKLPGWEFLATLDWKVFGDEPLFKVAPGADFDFTPWAKETKAYCDHCKSRRRRNQTFLIQNTESRKVLQVGRNCLADFLGGDLRDAKVLANQFDFLESLQTNLGEFSSENDWWDNGETSGTASYLLVNVLTFTSVAIKKFGWVSAREAQDSLEHITTTATRVLSGLIDAQKGEQKFFPDESHFEDALSAIEWAASLSDEEVHQNTYLFTIRQIARRRAVTSATIGYAASIIPTHHRHLEKEVARSRRRAEGEKSDYIGKVKERVRIEGVLTFFNTIPGVYGETHIWKLETEEGNRVTWFSSSKHPDDFDLGLGDKVVFGAATIKSHDEYKGIKETKVTRVSKIEAVT